MTQLSAPQLATHLQRQVSNLYVLCGEEPLQQLESADAIRKATSKQGEVERSSFTVSGANFDWSQITAAVSGLSLFAQQQIIEIYIPSGKPGREGGVMLQQLGQDALHLQGVIILISLPQSLDRATKNAAWFKALTQHGVVVMCNPVEPHALQQWLTQRMAQAGLQLEEGDEGRRTVAFLAEHVEGNMLAAHQEIEKLSLLHTTGAAQDSGQPQVIGFEEVQKSVMNVARYDLFALPQTILAGQVDRAMRMLDGLLSEGQAVVRIHWMLANEVMSLWKARSLLDEGKPLPLALREARVWGARERVYERILPRISSRDCLRLLRYAQVCDGLAKGLQYPGWPDDPVASLRRLVLEVMDVVNASLGQEKAVSVALRG